MIREEIAVLGNWRQFGEKRIPNNFDFFSHLLSTMQDYAACGEFDMAAVYGVVAAHHASARHCGIFANARLENCLLDVGRRALTPVRSAASGVERPPVANHILHVSTLVVPVGGHTRMLWRWINEDRNRTHSIALTKQEYYEIPEFLESAVRDSGGQIYRLEKAVGGLIARARLLRRFAKSCDVVVLHIFPDDVVPVLAFAHREKRPPIIFLDHGDHAFWIGGSITTVYGSMRASGCHLAKTRRGIEEKRVAPLPTILETKRRELSREEARRRLNMPQDFTLLVSVARQSKFRTIGSMNYARAHVRVLQTFPNTMLIAVGAGSQPDWGEAIAATGGRILGVDEIGDPSPYFHAADIYVDSFPFTSITSLLEAGRLGVPLVSRYPYSDRCGILGSDMPGLARVLFRAPTLQLYHEHLSYLIENEDERYRIGEETKDQIIREHTGQYWLRALEKAYDLALDLPPVGELPSFVDTMTLNEPDVYIESIHGGDCDAQRDTDRLIQLSMGLMPAHHRLRYWTKFLKGNRFRNLGRYGWVTHLFPEWMLYRAGWVRRDLAAMLR